MLELALELKAAINRYAALDKRYSLKPSEEELVRVKALVECLKPYYDATLKLSGTKYPTLNLFFPEFCEIYLSIRKMEGSQFPFVVEMGKEMFNKWDKYWSNGNTLLAIACILDPRCKLVVVEYYLQQMYPEECAGLIATIKACLNELFKEYSQAQSSLVQNEASSSSHASSVTCGASGPVSDTRAALKDFMRAKKVFEPTKSEIKEYLTNGLDEASLDDDFDILAWWKLKAPKYPILSRLTKDILAVPISTVASESTFSTSGRTLNPARSSLNDESIEVLICAQDWLRATAVENGFDIGDPLWPSDEETLKDGVCASEDSVVCR